MSSHNSSAAHGNEEGHDEKLSDVARLANKLKGVLDLNNSQDVDTTTKYAPGKSATILCHVT